MSALVRTESQFIANPDATRNIQLQVAAGAETGLTTWAEGTLDLAQSIAPVDTGDLRDSGRVEVAGQQSNGVDVDIVFDSDHAVYVEFGTGQRGAASAGAGPGPYSSTWPGMPAQPFLRPAVTAKEDSATDTVGAAIQNSIR